MQVTLGVILLATVGLAALVGRSRDRASAVALADQPVRLGGLEVKLPDGWDAEPKEAIGLTTIPSIIVAAERGGGVLMGSRTVQVVQSAHPAGRSPQEVLQLYLRREQGSVGSVKQITILGKPGVMTRFDGVHAIPDHPFGAGTEIPGWVAAGVVSGAGGDGQDLGVVVRVEGVSTAGPAGERLLREVAAALAVAPRAPETRATTVESAGK